MQLAVLRMRILSLWLTLLISLESPACSADERGDRPPLRLLAAASLTSLLPDVVEAFQNAAENPSVEFGFAASSVLAKQIENGADADIFLSASPQWIEYLAEQQLLKEQTRSYFLSNELVVVTAQEKSDVRELSDLLQASVKSVALADWTHVPAGIYALQALTRAGLWDPLQSKCVPSLDVRAALSYVERGDVGYGVVYRSDAVISDHVRIVVAISEVFQPNIRYAAAQTMASSHPLALAFLAFLRSETAQPIYEKHGFTLIATDD
jgi:molybdate transport system substrate-binding protein